MLRKSVVVISLLACSLFFSGCVLTTKKAALQINTNTLANVYLDGNLVGKTPYSSSELQAGEVLVRLVAEATDQSYSPWEGKVKLVGGILTLIDQELTSSALNSSGQILTLEKIKDKQTALISVITEPDGALIKLDGETKGFSPINIDSVPAGDHEIVLSKEGYTDKTIRARSVASYRLVVNAKLGQVSLPQTTPTPVPSGAVGLGDTGLTKPYVTISETETGFLRVRSTPSGTQLTTVKPGESFALVEEDKGWYKIEYEKGKEGWISSQYAKKIE